MGCGKSKLSVATDDGALQKGESTDAGSKNRREIEFKPFPEEKQNPDEIAEGMACQDAEGGENLKPTMAGKCDDVDVEALPSLEEATDSQEMLLLPREEEENEKKDDTLEGKKDESLEDEHGDGSEGFAGRLLSRDSPNHYFSSRKDDEALERILSEYNSPLPVDANKPTQEVPIEEDLKAKEEPATAVVAEPMVFAVEPTSDDNMTNPAPSA